MPYYCTLHRSSGQPAPSELATFLHHLHSVLTQTPLPHRVADDTTLGPQTEEVLRQALQQAFGVGFWQHDKAPIHTDHKDRADFYAQPTLDGQVHTVILEADPTRGDSIAKKFVSRVACTTATPLVYVALCYQGTQRGTVYEAEKYLGYCAALAQRLSLAGAPVLYLGFMPAE